MSGTGEARVEFGGEERLFRIRYGEIRRIEAKAEIGIGEVLRRLSKAVFVLSKFQGIEALSVGIDIRSDDVRETVFQGLRGGGMPDPEATKLVRLEIDDRGIQGLLDHVSTAFAVLWGTQEAPAADPPGEPLAGEPPTTPASPLTSTASSEPARS